MHLLVSKRRLTHDLFIASHVELEFYDAAHVESTVTHNVTFRTDIQDSVGAHQTKNTVTDVHDGDPREIHNNGGDTSPEKNDAMGTQRQKKSEWYTGRDQRIFHRVLVFKGPYKSYMGTCESVGLSTAKIQLATNGLTLDIPFGHLWNLCVENFL